MNLRLHRRGFLTVSAGALASWLTGPGVFAAEVGNRRRVGLIGCGWYGKTDLLRLLQIAPVEVVALCDVDRAMVGETAELVAARQVSRKRPRTHSDFREMLREKDLDLVLIDTPDHWHALPAIAAMEAGADLYLQKPISVDVLEGAAILATARRLGRVVQVGTQRRSTPHLIEAKERYVDTGALGSIGHVELCSYHHMRVRGNPADEAPPAGLDWDFWCGPAPLRPFNRAIHPRGWRSFREYGNGIVGDMCIHMLDTVRWMLGLGWPLRIHSTAGSFIDPGSIATVPDTQHAVFDFGNLAAVWTHRTWGAVPDRDFPWAAVIHGERGTLKLSVHRYEFVPAGRGETVRREVSLELDKFPEDADEKTLEKHVAPAIRRHMRDWLEAVATRGKPVADVEGGHISSASCILANIAADVHRTLAWDRETQRVRGDDEANSLLARGYRAPWKHPGA